MPTPQTSPLSPKAGSPVAFAKRDSFVPDARPYLVAVQDPKNARAFQRYPALFPHEPEDARLTGTTRSLHRRLLALSLPGKAISPSVPSAASEAVKSAFAGFKIA
jgi:hypothetical protein